MQLRASFATAERLAPGVRLHRPQQRRQIVAHQPAHRPRFTGRSGLAKVSGTPGKTRLINHFRINDSWYLVDLPGYGYARTSKTQRDEFAKIITDYVLRCERMHFLFVLVDSRLEPQKIDLRFIEMLGREGIPFGIVFTKTDKLSAAQLARSVERYKQVLGEQWEGLPPMFRSSSEKRTGREEILDFIGKCLTEC